MKKKLTKREKMKLAEQEAKRKAKEEEEEQKRLNALERQRRKEEAQRLKQKQLTEQKEHDDRKLFLSKSCKLLNRCRRRKRRQDIARRKWQDWNQYLLCDGKPNPGSLNEMNTYLFLWQLETETNYIDAMIVKSEEVLGLLAKLDELIDNPLEATHDKVENWKQVRMDVRNELQKRINKATFYLIRSFEECMEAIDLVTFHYFHECSFMSLCLWTKMIVPKPYDYQPKLVNIDFPQVRVSLEIPLQISEQYYVVRVMWLKYDHLSDMCRTWDAKPLPKVYHCDLYQYNLAKWREKQKVKNKLERMHNKGKKKKKTTRHDSDSKKPGKGEKKEKDEKKKKKGKGEPKASEAKAGGSAGSGGDSSSSTHPTDASSSEQSIASDEANSDSDLDVASDTERSQSPSGDRPAKKKQVVRTPSEVMVLKDKKQKKILKEYLIYKMREKDFNMRRHVILGGIYYIDLLEQPTQPITLKDRTTLTLLKGEEKIVRVCYYERYTPPPPKEEDDKPLHSADDSEQESKPKEDGLNRLILINITLPDSVLWFEPPTPVQWSHKKRTWTSRFIFDNRFNEEKQLLTFRVGSMLPIGLCTQRFINLPYQAWEMRPDWKGGPGGVFLSITAATIIVEFIIKDDNRICLNSLQNANGNALQDIIGVYYEPHTLIRIMRKGGVDVFPDHDSSFNMENARPKHMITEKHAYHCMAMLSTTYNFSWSRWNLLAGPENIVMQMREFLDRKRLPNYSMLLVTPQRALLVECTEVSQAFNEKGVEGMDYYPDIYFLAQAHACSVSKEKIEKVNLTLMENVYFTLCSIRMLSFS